MSKNEAPYHLFTIETPKKKMLMIRYRCCVCQTEYYTGIHRKLATLLRKRKKATDLLLYCEGCPMPEGNGGDGLVIRMMIKRVKNKDLTRLLKRVKDRSDSVNKVKFDLENDLNIKLSRIKNMKDTLDKVAKDLKSAEATIKLLKI